MNRATVVLIGFFAGMAGTLGGCIPLGEFGGVDSATASRLAAEIPIYPSSDPRTNGYKNLGAVSAWSCDDTLLGGGGDRDQLVAKLRQEAAKVDADALIDLSCGKNASATGCLKSLKCTATAARLTDPAAR
jgi:hypothetical protein